MPVPPVIDAPNFEDAARSRTVTLALDGADARFAKRAGPTEWTVFQPTGLAVELVREAAQVRGIKLEWVESKGDWKGRADLSVLLSIKPARLKFVHISKPYLQTESCFIVPASSKYQAEELVRASGLDWTIFRPSLVFGVGDDFFGRVLKNLVSQTPVVPQIGDGHFLFRPIWVADLASIFVQAFNKP